MNEAKTMATYIVTHKQHGHVVVHDCRDKLQAVVAAAKIWDVPFTSIARECSFQRREIDEA